MNQVVKDHRPVLRPMTVSARARAAAINPNFWYPVAWLRDLCRTGSLETTLWLRRIHLTRSTETDLVATDIGSVEHRVDPTPHRPLAVLERYGIVWVFPGDPSLALEQSLPQVPEYDDPRWLVIPIPAHFNVHFSIVNENPIDVFHGHLHRDLQGWTQPVLTSLQGNDSAMTASYDVTFNNGWLPRLLGLTRSRARTVQKTITVAHRYPHCENAMPGKSQYYFMRQPIGPAETRSYSLLCVQIRLPRRLVDRIRYPLSLLLWRWVVKPFLDQDIDVMESEQRAYQRDPARTNVEINPAVVAVQRITIAQHQAAEQAEAETAVTHRPAARSPEA